MQTMRQVETLMFSNNDIVICIPLPFLLIFLLLHLINELPPLFFWQCLHNSPPICLQLTPTLSHNMPFLHLRNIEIVMRSPHDLAHRREILGRVFRVILKLARTSIEVGCEPIFSGLGIIDVFGGTFFGECGNVKNRRIGS